MNKLEGRLVLAGASYHKRALLAGMVVGVVMTILFVVISDWITVTF